VDGYYENENGQKYVLEFNGKFWHGCLHCYNASTVNPVNGSKRIISEWNVSGIWAQLKRHFLSKDSNREKSTTSGCACTHHTLPREPLRGHVTFDWILHNFRLRMRTPKGNPSGSPPVAMILVLLYYYSEKKREKYTWKTREIISLSFLVPPPPIMAWR
jgi:hypothetical protein